MEETKKKKKKKSKKRTGPLKLDWNECPLFMPRTYDQTVDFVENCYDWKTRAPCMGMHEKNTSFGTALHRAVSRCDVESVKYLVGHGASLSSRNYACLTPLDVAHELLFSFKCAAIAQNQNSQKNNRLREVERIIRFLEGTLNERTKIQPLVSLVFCAQKMTQIDRVFDEKKSSDDEENKAEAEEKAEKPS